MGSFILNKVMFMTNFYFAFILLLHYWAKHKHPCIYKSSHVIWLDSYTYIGNGDTTPLDLYVSWAQFLFACKTHWQVLRQILSWSLPAPALHDLKNIGGRLSSLLSWFLFLHSDSIPLNAILGHLCLPSEVAAFVGGVDEAVVKTLLKTYQAIRTDL